jgi:hypothetical protein
MFGNGLLLTAGSVRPISDSSSRATRPCAIAPDGTQWLPIRDQFPAERIERYLAGLVIAADDQQVAPTGARHHDARR